MVTLAGDACGVKKHKETYGEPTPEKILGGRLLTKPFIMMKRAGVSDCFLGEFLPFCEKYFEKIIFSHNFPFFGKEITVNCHNWLHTQKGFFYFSEISPNFVRLVNWQSSTRELSQIWLQVREESRFFFKPHIILATYKNLIWSKYGKFNICFPQNMVILGLLFPKKIL
jgi:hypothetical protein